MQRFKKELLRSPYSQPRLRVGFSAADHNGKFNYGTPGTISQFAQWRAWRETLLKAGANLRLNDARSMSRQAVQDARLYRNLGTLVFARLN